MTTRLLVGAGMLLWVGLTLLLSSLRRFNRPSLSERIRPYQPSMGAPSRPGVVSVQSVAEVLGPLAGAVGDRLAAVFGVGEQLELRLRRVHSPLDVATFRTRQMGWSGAALLAGALVAASGAPAALGLLCVLGAPLLAFLVIEQRLSAASEAWQRAVGYELPVVSEQLAMLINAGYSLGAALARVVDRGQGCCARDLARVLNRIRQGVSENQALREWADVVHVDGVDRLVSVLALNQEASDLGRLVSAEARQTRRELQRNVTATIERRAQQVWVPVTVAALVPGVILLAVPFLAALRLFASS